MKHTPEPWTIEENDGYTNIESKLFTIAVDVQPNDAPLIANAPDLLKAIKRLITSIPITGNSIAMEYDLNDVCRIIKRIEG